MIDFNHLGFLLFSPDATTTRRHAIGLQLLNAVGLRVVHYAWKRVTAEQVEALYAENRARQSHFPTRWVRRLFGMDESLLCLVRSDRASGRSVAETLTELKGPSDPSRGRPGQLRYELAAESKILNFVHASDSPDATARETSIFFDTLAPAMANTGHATLPRPLASLQHQKSVSPDYARWRIKQSLARSRGWTDIPELSQLLDAEEDLALRRKEPTVRAALERLALEQRRVVADAGPRRSHGDASLFAAPDWDLDAWIASVRAAGGQLTPWDELILRCETIERCADG